MKHGYILTLIIFLYGVFNSINVYPQKSPVLPNSENNEKSNLLPVPQRESYTGRNFSIGNNWILEAESNIISDDPSIRSLITGLNEHAGLKINPTTLNNTNASQLPRIRLIMKSGSVATGHTTDTNHAAIIKQAYQLKLSATEITIRANAQDGLFYGVQTLLQLLKPGNGQTLLPEGEINDWPDLELRIIYYDCAHHLEKMDAFKRIIRQAGFYKINGIALKLEGHFQFKNAEPIIEPYAFAPAEYQELTDYAKLHYVQLIPYLDAPAHVSFILKHPEYQSLRAFPNSNYELSVVNPETDELLLAMFDNLMDANKGGQYILLSTDEAYYVGKTDDEKEPAAASGGNGRLLAEFITRISNKLHEKGRTIIFWGEYPLTSSDISALPSHLVNGEYNEKWAPIFKQHGIRQLIYTSTQGEEPFFPNYYPISEKTVLNSNGEIQLANESKGRVGEVLKTIHTSLATGNADFMGVIVAAWADAGLNTETFWLGYAAGSAPAWNLASKSATDLTDRFYNSFYGAGRFRMSRVYQLLSTQAELWNKSWEWQPSRLRTQIIGNSQGIYNVPRPARDQTLTMLPLPTGKELSLEKEWSTSNLQRLQSAEAGLRENDELVELLNRNIRDVDYQQYNLQVLLSVTQLCRQNLHMLLDLQRIDQFLKLSSVAASTNPKESVSYIDRALDQVRIIRDRRNDLLRSVTALWYKDWYPRVPEANGHKYLNQVDDIKDHLPVRTVDMSYLIYRELNYPLGKWAEEVRSVRNQVAKDNNLPIRTEVIEWEKY
jgi:hexosaminidase